MDQDHQRAEPGQEDAMLLHEKCRAEEHSADEQQIYLLGPQGPPKCPSGGDAEEGYEMRGVGRRAQDRRTDGQQRISRGGNTAGQRIKQVAGEQENEHDGGQVDNHQTQVDAGGSGQTRP